MTDSSKVNERYLSTEELQSNLEMAQRKKAVSVGRLNYLSVKVSKVLNTEGIQVSKDHGLDLKEIIDNSDNQFNEETPWGCFGSNRTNKQKVNPKVCGGIPSWYDGPYLSIYHTSPADYKHITSKCNKFFVLSLSHLHYKKVYQLYNTNQWIQQRCHREDHN